ncbi:amidohydrolase family protein [Pontibacter toksunensis]|uniref:Amidohydrolase family protein n=1 Tax=Pontibacter toksunensis TaxID=1332631 RepID=A0ABW6C0Z6_9BACT
MIIDCHCHAGKGDGLTGPWDTDAPLGEYMKWAKEAGVNKTVLFAAFHSDYRFANQEVARIVNRYPSRFYGFAFLHPVRDRGRVFEMVKTAVKQYHFCGIKVHRYDARITREICETARSFHLPILYDVMGEVSAVELLATQYPGVNFIIPHLGSFADDWKAQMGLIDHLVRHPNVYTDTSGVRRFDLLKIALVRAGAHKILFGSDGPWLHPGVELAKIKALHLTARDLQMVVAGNFLRLISKVQRKPLAVKNALGTTNGVSPQKYLDPWLANKEAFGE